MPPTKQRDNGAARKAIRLPSDGMLDRDFTFQVFCALLRPGKPVPSAVFSRFWRALVAASNQLKILNNKCQTPGCDAQAGTCEHDNWNVWAEEQKISIAEVMRRRKELLESLDSQSRSSLIRLLEGIELARLGNLFPRRPIA